MPRRVLVVGFGNPGRRDDGLGPALAERIERLALPGVTVEADYQLTVEDAAAAAEHDVVVFADADTGGPEPFSFRPVEPKAEGSFTSHHVSAEAVVAMARDLFGRAVKAYILGIRGYDFGDLAEGLSDRAAKNLDAAVNFLAETLRSGQWDEQTRTDTRTSDHGH